MILALPPEAIHAIHKLFAERYAGAVAEPVQDWIQVRQRFISKIRKANNMQDFRGGLVAVNHDEVVH